MLNVMSSKLTQQSWSSCTYICRSFAHHFAISPTLRFGSSLSRHCIVQSGSPVRASGRGEGRVLCSLAHHCRLAPHRTVSMHGHLYRTTNLGSDEGVISDHPVKYSNRIILCQPTQIRSVSHPSLQLFIRHLLARICQGFRPRLVRFVDHPRGM